MGFLELVTVDGVRDGVQVLLCGVVLACLACRRLTSTRRAEVRPAPLAAFADEVGLQSLRQQAEQALAAIEQAVRAERLQLNRWMAPIDPGGAAAADSEPADLIPFRLGGGEPGAAASYDALPRLAAGGLTPRELAAQTHMPAGEVELALKLRRLNA
jgi:hypothetical protein